MNSSLLFDFRVDKENKTAYITRQFDVPRDLVWDAWTKPELLDQWWAPRPYAARTKSMEFKVGGRRLYAMVSPEGNELWAMHEYTSISPVTNFKMKNAFADKDGNPDLPGSDWDLTFEEDGETTTVNIIIYNESRERFEKMLEMGFKEGFTMGLGNLDELLGQMSGQKG